MNAEVSLIKCSDYNDGEAVYQKTGEAIELIGGIGSIVKTGDRVLIKPNLLAAKSRDMAVTTDPAIVGALIRLVKDAGGVALVGDSPGLGSGTKVAEKCGIMDVVKKYGAEFTELTTPVDIENPNGLRFKKLVVAKEALDADVIINAPKLKTHAQMYLTMGIKNIFGCVPGKRKVQWHMTAGIDVDAFADMLLELAGCIFPALTVLDAVTSMEGNGPASGEPRQTGFIAASTNPVALDLTICERILGASAADVPVLRRARAHDIGPKSSMDVTVLGTEPAELKANIKDFKFPPTMHTSFTKMLPPFLDKHIRKAMTSRPHIVSSKCMICNVCVGVCPTETIINYDNYRVVIDVDGCIRCYCCQEMCPHRAITVKEGWLKKLIPGL